jgi:hypothetical protein
MESLGFLGRNKSMVKNILEDVKYIDPDLSLPVPDGMCKNCIGIEKQLMCDNCKETQDTKNE